MFKIYIDADACPVKEDTYRVAKRYALSVIVVTHIPILVPRADWIIPVVVEQGFDAVDDWITAEVQKNDIVVTNDILLASRLIEKGAKVIDPRGKILDEENIGDAIATRELMSELRQRGELGLGPKKKTQKHHSNYLASLDLLINRVKKSFPSLKA